MVEKEALLPIVQKYFEKDIQGAARTLEMMTEDEAAHVLEALPIPMAVRALQNLQVSYAAALLENADASIFKEALSALDPQYAATLFMHLSEDARERLLGHLPKTLRSQVKELLTYPEDSMGRLMTTRFLSFHQNVTVQEAIEKIRSLAKRGFPASYAYVIDDQNHLVGVMNMLDLMLASPEQKLESFMRKDIFAVHCLVSREEAADQLSKRRYFAAPVVDGQNRILGIIKAEQLIQGIQDEATEDLQKMFGVGGDERVFSPILLSIKKRLPWLHVNLATAFLAAAVVALFEDIIAKITVLAVFLPVVAGQGGNAGAQSLAIVMRGLVMREIPRQKVWRLIMKESCLGIINGAIIGTVTAAVAWLWNGNPWLGLVIGLGMLVNLFFAGLAGASIPVVMKNVGLDPAQSSSIILTTVTDVMGFFAFLGFAVVFLKFLV
ncbi:MAG: magnesium transporter [Acidobacteria bacterium]|nr:magnesium transporter [Acidobacteriota bacterium]